MTVASRSEQRPPEATFVVVANRLPVDRVENPDGSADWRPSPGGLVTAFEPVMRSHEGAWVGWQRRPRRGAGALRQRRPAAGPGRAVVGGGRALLRGVLQRHPLAALPRRDRAPGVPPRVVGHLRRRQPALRRPDRPGRGPGCRGLGAGLPAPARPADAAEAAARPADRLLPAHPLPAARALRPAALARPDPRGPARRGPGRVPAARRRAELRPPGPPPAAPGDQAGPDHPRQRPRGDGPGLSHRHRREGTEPAGRYPRGRRAGRRDPQRPRRSQDDLPRRRPARLHQGSAGADPRLRGADRARARSTRTTPCWSSWPSRRGNGWTTTGSCATISTAWSAGSTATSAGSVARRSTTCTPPTRGRRWRRCTGPPTSWSSPRCATG